jgi:hypothetical protein
VGPYQRPGTLKIAEMGTPCFTIELEWIPGVYGCLCMIMEIHDLCLDLESKKSRHLPCWSKMRRYPGCQRWSPWMVSQTAQLLRQENNPSRWSKEKRSVGNSAASWDLIGFYRVISIHILISQSYSGSKNLYLSDQPSHSSKGKGWTPQKRNR